MSIPFGGYASPEQIMRDRAEYARKGIARGRSVVVMQYADGILFVAPNPSKALHKISEIYDRIGFAAVGRYNEFESLRLAGIRYADINGYTFNRTDVTGRGLANLYAQHLGMIFTESIKSFEVEIVVAEVGEAPEDDQIYRITFDGSVFDEQGMAVIGGQAEAVGGRLKERYREGLPLPQALDAALSALTEPGGERPPATQIEVAVLDRSREHRKFLRLTGPRLEKLLEAAKESQESAKPAAEAQTEQGNGEQAQGERAQGEQAPGTAPPIAPEGDIDTGSGE
ncbi:proteasome subunit alpha [Microbispora hainanensis]|uniref:Proteasome subunit alpha n=1 Tax=Microbispora hainanensis TaxID=568844 RepID=A0A544YXH6_9ACTN|nr:proteasome subunit alpha [Microbispora hainanensis]TQS21460.1 proteasome subunit alpha [Microbispora hainanensis]